MLLNMNLSFLIIVEDTVNVQICIKNLSFGSNRSHFAYFYLINEGPQ